MSELTPEQKQALEEQKKNCVFCRIIEGEIPAKKVYEDEHMLAILDINPLVKGHTLVMPKEHYPIMPLIPQETFVHMFERTRELAGAIKKGLLMTGTTIVVANGQVAGQMSPHFMFHIIPRESGDGADMFSTEGKAQQPSEDVLNALKNNLPIMVENHFKRYPQEWHTPQEVSQKFSKDQVIALVEKNQQLKDFIEKAPQEFLQQIDSHEQLKKIFADVDPVEVIKHYVPDFEPQTSPSPSGQGQSGDQANQPGTQEAGAPSQSEDPATGEPSPPSSVPGPSPSSGFSQTPASASDSGGSGSVGQKDIEAATALAQRATEGVASQQQDASPQDETAQNIPQSKESQVSGTADESGQERVEDSEGSDSQKLEGLFRTIDANPKLRGLVLGDTETLKAKVDAIPQLQGLFEGYDIEHVCARYDQREKEIQEIIRAIEENPKLKEMLHADPAHVKEKMQSVPQLKELFRGYEPELIRWHMVGDAR